MSVRRSLLIWSAVGAVAEPPAEDDADELDEPDAEDELDDADDLPPDVGADEAAEVPVTFLPPVDPADEPTCPELLQAAVARTAVVRAAMETVLLVTKRMLFPLTRSTAPRRPPRCRALSKQLNIAAGDSGQHLPSTSEYP